MRVVALIVVAFVALAATAQSAEACRCCGPCDKRYRERIELPRPVAVEVYVRERPAPMPKPAKHATVMALLTGSRWQPRKPPKSALRVRLFDGSNVPETVTKEEHVDQRIVRQLVLEKGHFLIELNGRRYQVSPCRDGGRATTCLVLRR